MLEEDIIKFINNVNISALDKSKHFIRICKGDEEKYSLISDLLITNNATEILEHFLADYNNLSIRKKRKCPYVSGSEWTSDELETFSIIFDNNTTSKDICKDYELSEKAKKFINDNKDINQLLLISDEIKDKSILDTPFKGYLLFTIRSPSIESCVDDMIQNLLQEVLSSDFLIKTRYETILRMSDHNTKATADIVAIYLPNLQIGVIAVEDKPNSTSTKEREHNNAEAQLIAEGIAIAQQKRWPKNFPVFMIRVLETYVTFYKAIFTEELINSVSTGKKRDKPFIVTKLEPKNEIFSNDRPGYNLLVESERNDIVRILNNIGMHIKENF